MFEASQTLTQGCETICIKEYFQPMKRMEK
jgi:hypothetical protein